MSFSFPGEMPLIRDLMKATELLQSVKYYTCAMGNLLENISLDQNVQNYPSAYARHGISNVIEVAGIMHDSNGKPVLWEYTDHDGKKGSNYVTDNFLPTYASDAVIDPTNAKNGGTSFASPRVLADFITGLSPVPKDLKLPIPGKMKCFYAS